MKYLAILLTFIVSFNFGVHYQKQKTIKRAEKINKECYSDYDLETIIFGEIQE